MRLFIALELSEEIRQKCRALLGDLASLNSRVKWVSPPNLHLTLKFLGQVSETEIPPLLRVLHQVAEDFPVFELNFSGLGAFPRLERPQVFWMKGEGEPELSRLQKAIETPLEALGFPREERAFSPHLTLGRVKEEKGLREVIQKFKERSNYSAGKFTVRDFALFESQLQPAGPVYRVIEKFSLRGGN